MKSRRARRDRQYEYFVLARDPERDPKTGELKIVSNVVNAKETIDERLGSARGEGLSLS